MFMYQWLYKKYYLCQWLDSCDPVAGWITHNVNKWNNYYSFIERIEFYFDSAVNTIESSIRVTFCYFFRTFGE